MPEEAQHMAMAMRVVGGGLVHFYGAEDEMPHDPEPDTDWQESFVLYLWDRAQGVYAFFRLGHEPNRDGGIGVHWINIWVPGQYYKNYGTLPLSSPDRTVTAVTLGSLCRYSFDGLHHWKVDEGDIHADLTMEDFHQGLGFWPSTDANLTKHVAKNHIEASGRVTGTVRFKGREFNIGDGLGYRDHSWGNRRPNQVRAHRWVPAVFGPDLILQAMSMYLADGSTTKIGYVIRNEEILIPSSIDILAYSEEDGVTTRGGELTVELPSGEELTCVYRAVGPGGMSFHHGYPCVDTPCSVSINSRQGVGCFEAANNTLGGTVKPVQSALNNGMIDNGIFATAESSFR